MGNSNCRHRWILIVVAHLLRCEDALRQRELLEARRAFEESRAALVASKAAVQNAKLHCMQVRLLRAEGQTDEAEALLASLELPTDYWEVRRAIAAAMQR